MPQPRRGITRSGGGSSLPDPSVPTPNRRSRVVANFSAILARRGAAGFRHIGGLEPAEDDTDEDESELDDLQFGEPDGLEEQEEEQEEEEEEDSEDQLVPLDNDETDEEEEEEQSGVEEGDEEEGEDVEGDEEEEEEEDIEEEGVDGADASGDGQATPPLVGLKEIGHLASWTVSTSKPGCGVAELRSEDTNLFWQSDGPQPHLINIHFAKRVFVKRIRVFLDYAQDESYTPTKIAIYAGTGYHDLQEVCVLEFNQPTGWQEAPLEGVHADGILRTFLIQVCVLSNHQNGKDTHVRGLQIYSPLQYLESQPSLVSGLELDEPNAGDISKLSPIWFNEKEIPFNTVKMMSELELR
ncbi:anaphase promoting complex subunit doc1 [Orbilia blumenaviensis]|uniref:Anaphase promoting complex subunit doc1 n=1 Tax=Orbilia blumenaviensis TaxID=1796055 RepID=A0AAV9UQC8_9PEZI